MVTADEPARSGRPRGGRRPEDYPDVRARDARVLAYLRDLARGHYSYRITATRNSIASDLDEPDHRKISYSLERLRVRGLVRRVAQGNEGHGYWEAIMEGTSE